MRYDGRKFVRLVPDPLVMGNRDPLILTNGFEPFLIRTIGREMINMPMGRQAAGNQDFREAFS